MDKIKEFVNKHFLIIAVVWILAIIGFFIWLTSGPSDAEVFDQTVTNHSVESNKAVREATNANNAAINADIERRTEDAARTRIIKPKLENARRQSEDSKAALEAARKTYNETKPSPETLNSSDADNCLRLEQLFPDVTFSDCQ